MPTTQIAVQSAHAALESGIKFGTDNNNNPSSIIILSIKNKEKLIKSLEYVSNLGIKTVQFNEPDWSYGFTSFATEPLSLEQKKMFRKFHLWNGKSHE